MREYIKDKKAFKIVDNALSAYCHSRKRTSAKRIKDYNDYKLSMFKSVNRLSPSDK